MAICCNVATCSSNNEVLVEYSEFISFNLLAIIACWAAAADRPVFWASTSFVIPLDAANNFKSVSLLFPLIFCIRCSTPSNFIWFLSNSWRFFNCSASVPWPSSCRSSSISFCTLFLVNSSLAASAASLVNTPSVTA